jgi:phosphoglycerol transferase MdoB-like AlkP superfamily enzyme
MKRRNTVLFYLVCVHLAALLFMFAGRCVLLLHNWEYAAGVELKYEWTLSAFVRGLWFDNVIACYASLLPLLLMPLLAWWVRAEKWLFGAFGAYYILIYTLVWGITSANIPYFGYFLKPVNASVLNWKEESLTSLRMLFQENSYVPFILMFVVWSALFGCAVRRIGKVCKRRFAQPSPPSSRRSAGAYLVICCVLIAFCLLGIRGRLGYNPIKTSQAYFCNNTFFNQLGLNPAFYFVRDVLESRRAGYEIEKPTAEEAIVYVKEKSGLVAHPEEDELIARDIRAGGEPENLNVIIVLMESMSADFLDVKENGCEITPFLNQLIGKSYYFENIYSAGIHTNHGIFATLYGMPVLLSRNMMKNVDIPLCQGIPSILQEEGYHTMFFVSHEAQYDNINAFVRENGIEELYSEEHYPASRIVNCWGVADDYLFEYALNTFNRKAEEEKGPFFASILTTSNHPPYHVPEAFKAVSADPQLQIVAFADDAIRQFMSAAAGQPWYEHTLFVFVGDHGKLVGASGYDMPLSYNHVPLILYSPAFMDAPKRFGQFGGQIDIFPTIMGLLKRSYRNNTLGVDLLKEKRPFIYFSSDDAIGCIDSSFFYSYNIKTKIEGLYKYKESNRLSNLVSSEKARADSMWKYAASMLQTAHYMFEHQKTRR